MARQVETTYGDALLELALEEGSLNMLYEEAQALVTVLQENEELLRILKHPQIDKDEKRKIVDNIFKGRVSKDMVGLFGIMVEKDCRCASLFYQTGKTSKKYRSCKCDKCGCTYRCTEGIDREASA